MDWQILIIPLIAAGVWILGTVFGKTEDPPARRPTRLPGDGKRPTAQTSTDLDRFLEEAKRRREAAMQRQSQAPPDETPPRPVPRPEPTRASRPPQERRPQKQREAARTQGPTRREPQRAERTVASGSLPPIPFAENIPLAEVVENASVALTQSGGSLRSPAATGRVPTSPIAAQVIKLLRTPRSMATAFVLREILDPPLSRRGRR